MSYPTIACQYCGDKAVLTFNEETIAKLLDQQACHGCGFWLDRAADDQGRNKNYHVITPDWEHYVMIDEEVGMRFRGFGGRSFTVNWLDPERQPTVTTNLWHQGEIPELHRHRFKINAHEWGGDHG